MKSSIEVAKNTLKTQNEELLKEINNNFDEDKVVYFKSTVIYLVLVSRKYKSSGQWCTLRDDLIHPDIKGMIPLIETYFN